jgi:hypothetical protein
MPLSLLQHSSSTSSDLLLISYSPGQDPEILQLGLLFLLAPVGMILGVVAGVRGAPQWLIWVVEIASLPLLAVGLMASSAV